MRTFESRALFIENLWLLLHPDFAGSCIDDFYLDPSVELANVQIVLRPALLKPFRSFRDHCWTIPPLEYFNYDVTAFCVMFADAADSSRHPFPCSRRN